MKIYMAAVYTNNYMPGQKKHSELLEHEQKRVSEIPYILESYHYIHKQSFVDEIRANNGKIFLDSGAFSSYNLGIHIDIKKYCNYINENMDIFAIDGNSLMVAGLDGIGNAYETWYNLSEMYKYGIKAMPCFHANEDYKYLEYYLKHYEYISLGGMVGGSSKQLITWLDDVWNKHLVDRSGKPRIKVHGFGITAEAILERYPWYSIDSSAWVQGASFGYIITQEYRNITLSPKSPLRKMRGQHFDNFADIEREKLIKMIEDHGFDYQRLATVYQSRAAYNLWSFGEINKNELNREKNYKFLNEPGLF